MIQLFERKAHKLPGSTSIFVVCEYNRNVVDIIKCCAERNWDVDSKEWEVPIYELSSLINKLVDIDSVELNVLRDKKKVKIEIPRGYKFKLKPYDYQVEGIEYGLNHNGWILGDDMGLGKTYQTTHLAGILKETEGLKHCLVICGKASLKNNWVRDIKKSSELDSFVLGTRYQKSGKPYIGSIADRVEDLKKGIKEFFIITNIETIRDKNIVKELTKNKLGIDMIVLDEAHACKSPTSQQGKNLLKLTKAKRRIALTGTIIVNNPLDAYVPLKWTGNESADYTHFKSRYCVFDSFRRGAIIGFKNLDLLHQQLSTCMLRRLKKDKLKDLPPKTYITDYVDMTDKQAMLYENVKDSIRDEIDKVPISSLNQMALSTRLRQCTAWTGILSSTITESAKLDRLDDLLEQIVAQGDKAIVFSVFKPTVDIMRERYAKYGIVTLTGDETNDNEIEKIKDKFRTDDNCKVIAGTWQKMGTGHTLTAASYVIFIDTPWTDADFQQCVDRAHRIGLMKNLTVITLVAKGTFDERVLEIVESKKTLSDYVVSAKVTTDKQKLKEYLGIA